MVIRLVLLGHHYRSDWQWDEADVSAAGARLDKWRARGRQGLLAPPPQHVVTDVLTALADDLDAPTALRLLDHWANATDFGDDSDRGRGGRPGRWSTPRWASSSSSVRPPSRSLSCLDPPTLLLLTLDLSHINTPLTSTSSSQSFYSLRFSFRSNSAAIRTSLFLNLSPWLAPVSHRAASAASVFDKPLSVSQSLSLSCAPAIPAAALTRSSLSYCIELGRYHVVPYSARWSWQLACASLERAVDSCEAVVRSWTAATRTARHRPISSAPSKPQPSRAARHWPAVLSLVGLWL